LAPHPHTSQGAEDGNTTAYKSQKIRSYDERFRLEDDSILALEPEYEEVATIHIQSIFPQLVIQQIHNTLVARQVLPKGPDHYELVFHFFGYEDDTPEMRNLRIKQANLWPGRMSDGGHGAAGWCSAAPRATLRLNRSLRCRTPPQSRKPDTESLMRRFGWGTRNWWALKHLR
jgi:hypothetical protein